MKTTVVVESLSTIQPDVLFQRLPAYFKPKLLSNLETTPDIEALGLFEDYYTLLNKRLQYLHKLLQDFRSKRLAMINKDRNFFQYNSGDLVYLISLFTSQWHTASRK